MGFVRILVLKLVCWSMALWGSLILWEGRIEEWDPSTCWLHPPQLVVLSWCRPWLSLGCFNDNLSNTINLFPMSWFWYMKCLDAHMLLSLVVFGWCQPVESLIKGLKQVITTLIWWLFMEEIPSTMESRLTYGSDHNAIVLDYYWSCLFALYLNDLCAFFVIELV